MKNFIFPKMSTKNIVVLSVLIAVSVVLKAFFTIYLFSPNNKLIFHNIPIMIISIVFGPIWGVVCAGLTDLASLPFTPGWNPLFMLPVLLWGLIPGMTRLLFRKVNLPYLIIVETVSHVCVSIANTVVMGFLYGWDIAFGKVSVKELKIGFMSDVFKWSQQAVNFGDVFYIRILYVVIVMLIKIPIDIYLLSVLNKRILQKDYIGIDINNQFIKKEKTITDTR